MFDDPVAYTINLIKIGLEQYHARNFIPLVATFIMLAVFFLQKFLLPTLDKSKVPLVSAALGVGFGVASNLAALAVGSQPADWIGIIVTGLFTGATASGFWSLVGKKIFAEKDEGGRDDPPPPAPFRPLASV